VTCRAHAKFLCGNKERSPEPHAQFVINFRVCSANPTCSSGHVAKRSKSHTRFQRRTWGLRGVLGIKTGTRKKFSWLDGGGWKPWSESSRVQFEGVGSWVLGIWKGDKSETAPGAPEVRVHRRTVVVGGPGRARDSVVLLLVFLALENRDLEVRA